MRASLNMPATRYIWRIRLRFPPAEILGWEEGVGSLEPGKKADFVLFDLSHPEWVPYQDPVQALVWSATPASIRETWVGGRRVYAEGSVTTVEDEAALRVEATERAKALLRRAGLLDTDVPVTTTAYE